ncbi:hypothetical protein [Methylomonas sp. MK1]|uniref:hypothetical protein n=1 Tax=Methylomonas sp. MK1 TaxID=1131552 RepID=UPI00037CB478|nr:hypothetical protein [Methylomonas sp. MK1]
MSRCLAGFLRFAAKTRPALRLSGTKNLHFANAPFPRFSASVEIYDREWIEEIIKAGNDGINSVKRAGSIDEIISVLAATLIEISFIQVGFMPNRRGEREKVTLKKENWKLNIYRSAIYIQTDEQKDRLFISKQGRKIGFDEQFELLRKYKRSKSKLTYIEWCSENAQA